MEYSRGLFDSLQTAEQKLWVAVLATALTDALSIGNLTRMKTTRRWFRVGGENFKMVCELANFDADFVRRNVLSALDQGDYVQPNVRYCRQLPQQSASHLD